MTRSVLSRRMLLGALPLLAACAGATQAPPVSSTARNTASITENDLRARLYLIADDSMGGRPTGSRGHIMATQYVADEMKRLGLQPAGDNGTYFQNVPFVRRAIASGSNITVDGRVLEPNRDFAAWSGVASVKPFDGVQVVYGGYIGDTTTFISPDAAAGKFVILRGRAAGLSLARGVPGNRWEKAAVLAVVNPEAVRQFWPQIAGGGPTYVPPTTTATTAAEALPITIEPAIAAVLMGMPWDTLMRTGTTGRTVRGRVSFTEERLTARNVVAILPGSDPALRGQYVAIGAHIDHDPPRATGVDHDSLHVLNAMLRRARLEKGSALTLEERNAMRVNVDSLRRIRPARRDSILNGADDDGSGTVAVLEIAEAMAAASTKPRRSTLFIWHVAEELGLYGAMHFTDFPTVNRDSIVATLNIDMIGRGGAGEEIGGGPTYVQLIGWRRLSNELGDIIEATNATQSQPFKFDLQYDAAGHPEQYYCRSDHYMYARYGIPVAFFTTGSHGDYHQVTDEPQYIDYTKLKNVTQLIHDVAWRVSNLPHRVRVDGPKPDPKGQCRQ